MLMNFNFNLDLAKTETTDEGKFIEGVASTTGLDQQKEIMSAEALSDMVKSVGIPLTTSHRAEIEDTIGEVVDSRVDADGRFIIKAKIDEADPKALALYHKIESGRKCGFSVGGKITNFKPSLDKSVRRVITGVELDHIMLTRKPVNAETFAVALSKALDSMPEDDIATQDNINMEDTTNETIEKAGATLSADTKNKLKNIHAIGDGAVKGAVRDLLGADADDVLGEESPNIADGDDDDSTDDSAPLGVVAGKSDETVSDLAKSFAELKAEIIETVKAELAKSKPEPKTPEVIAKSEEPSVNSLTEALRKAIGG